MRLLRTLPTLLLLGACTESPELADSPPPLPDPPAWTLEPTLAIGDGPSPDDVLTRVGGVLPMPDGSVWILQPEDTEVRVFSAEGDFVMRVGGRGEGPGEFTVPTRMGRWPGDTVWVADPVLRRIALFGPDGTFLRDFRSPVVSYTDSFTVTAPAAVFDDGTAVATARHVNGIDEWGPVPVLRYDPTSGQPLAEVARLEGTDAIQLRWQGRSLATGTRPFSDAPVVAHAPARNRTVVVEQVKLSPAGDALIAITALSPDGTTAWTRDYAFRPAPIPQEEVDSVMRSGIEAFQRFTRLEGRLTDDEAERAYRESVTLPPFRPPVRDVRVAGDGTIWLAWSAPPGAAVRWWILGPSGEVLGRVEVDADLEVQAVTGRAVWAVATDALDVERLVRLEVVGP